MTDAAARPSAVYYVAMITLVLAVGTGIGLFYLLTAGEPSASATYTVSGASAAPCPPGTGAPACFTFGVTNSGGERGSANCTVMGAAGTAASFANDEAVAQVALLPNETREVYVKVIVAGSDVIRSPSLVCT